MVPTKQWKYIFTSERGQTLYYNQKLLVYKCPLFTVQLHITEAPNLAQNLTVEKNI